MTQTGQFSMGINRLCKYIKTMIYENVYFIMLILTFASTIAVTTQIVLKLYKLLL